MAKIGATSYPRDPGFKDWTIPKTSSHGKDANRCKECRSVLQRTKMASDWPGWDKQRIECRRCEWARVAYSRPA